MCVCEEKFKKENEEKKKKKEEEEEERRREKKGKGEAIEGRVASVPATTSHGKAHGTAQSRLSRSPPSVGWGRIRIRFAFF